MQPYDKLVFLKNFIKASNIHVGDYTYFDDKRHGPENFEEYNVLYNYDFSKVKLVIGKFCAIVAGISLLIRLDTPPCDANGYNKFEKAVYSFFVNPKINYWILFLIAMFLLVMNRSVLLFCATH